MLAKCLQVSNQVPKDVGFSVMENDKEFLYVPAKVCSQYVNNHHGKLKDGTFISRLKFIIILRYDECIWNLS